MGLKGTLKQIGADVGDWVQFEDNQPYGPLTLHEVVTDERTGFTLVKKADRPLPKNCRARLQAEGKAYPRSSCQACGATFQTGLRCLHMFPDTNPTKPVVDKNLQPVGGLVLAAESPLVGEVPVEETRPSILARLDAFIEREGMDVDTKGEWEGLRKVIAPALSGKLVVDMAGAMDKITPELIVAMAPLLTQPMIQTLEQKASDQEKQIEEFKDVVFKLGQEAVAKQEEVNAAKAHATDIGFRMLEIEGVVMSMIDTVAQLRDATGLTDENTPAEIVSAGLKRIADAAEADKALIRIREAIVGAGKSPKEIADEVEDFFVPRETNDYWASYDNQTGQWVVQQEPITVVRSMDDEVLHLRIVGRENMVVAQKAFKKGYKARLEDLMQGGSQSSTDFFREGRYAGRFHAFFPAGATADEKIAHYEEMIGWERAAKDATPLNFGDASWSESSLTKSDGTPARASLFGEVQKSILEEIQSKDRLHRDPKTAVLPELAWKRPDGPTYSYAQGEPDAVDSMREEILDVKAHPLMADGLWAGKTTGC